jgi:hypothetical protein
MYINKWRLTFTWEEEKVEACGGHPFTGGGVGGSPLPPLPFDKGVPLEPPFYQRSGPTPCGNGWLREGMAMSHSLVRGGGCKQPLC